MDRRQLVAFLATPAIAEAKDRLSLEGWIWMNLANRAKRPLIDMMDELFPSAPAGGFRNIELNDGFFTPATQSKTLKLVDQHQLRMPSVYVGGILHQSGEADKTIEKTLRIAALCRPYGCTAVVNNPNPKPQGAAKTDDELATQARHINRMDQALAEAGYVLRIHHHSPELENNAREWRHIFANTRAALCIDVEFVFRAQFDPSAFIREAGPRVTELHLRNRTNNSPLQAFEPGDIDYAAVAKTVSQLKLKPLIVVELAYHDDTVITRSFHENVRRSRAYARKLFGR
jgi:sugar phosphate isomerase/epimerase